MNSSARFRSLWLTVAALVLAAGGASPSSAVAAPPRVAVSIGPLHSLASAVMEGLGEPYLLIRGANSPHTYTLTPADARALSEADIVVWIGAGLETSLARPIASLAAKAKVLAVLGLPGIEALAGRPGGIWKDRDVSDHGHKVDAHAHEHLANHAAIHKAHMRSGRGHEVHESGHPIAADIDGHIWLDPRNAVVLSHALAETLGGIDPANAAHYRANAVALEERLGQLERDLIDLLAPVRGVPYAVFHDAYRYFEHRFALNAVGAMTVNPSRPPGAKRLSEIRAGLKESGAVCLFIEPQVKPALARTAVEGTKAKIAVLDPLGVGVEPGPIAYFTLLRAMGASLRACLSDLP